MMKTFPIGFWNYVSLEHQDATAVNRLNGSVCPLPPPYRSDPRHLRRATHTQWRPTSPRHQNDHNAFAVESQRVVN